MKDSSKAGKDDGASQAAGWTVCPCNNCSGNLEFESAHAGETVKCPQCGVDTVLFIPQVTPVGTKWTGCGRFKIPHARGE
jgi:DNA-directed RNA polymerase subunit RPC12/RpoP